MVLDLDFHKKKIYRGSQRGTHGQSELFIPHHVVFMARIFLNLRLQVCDCSSVSVPVALCVVNERLRL